ncbi:MAG TPA: tetratricopeptide repeat protein [Flavobacteriales bacterium]|nr:tetratricopeptide repeat protein [Flavobacteriales bacterium]
METSTEKSIEETIRFIDETNDFLWRSRGTSVGVENLVELGRQVHEKALSINYTYGIARSVLNASMGAFIMQNNVPLAMQYLDESLSIFTRLDDKKWIANTHGTMAIIQNTISNKESAVYNILKCLDYYENNKDHSTDGVMIYYVAGTVYKDLKKYTEAENYYLKGVEWENREKSNWSGRIFTGLASLYSETGNYEKALEYSFIALERLRVEGNDIGISRALSDIGVIYKRKNDFNTALKYLEQGLAIRLEKKLKQFIISSYMDIADVQSQMGNTTGAIDSLEKGMQAAIEIKQLPKLSRIYQDLSANYKIIKNFEKAVFYLEKQLAVNAELNKSEVENRIKSLHNAVVKEKEEEIERLRNVELKNAYELISEKNKEITDSINYARRIQLGILPSDEELSNTVHEHFVLYKPKDIVSGDFYWCKKINPPETDLNVGVIAAVDCTGHGVPGAFMSMLGQTLLNQSVKSGEVTSPADALNYLNKELPNNLKSQDKQQSIKDGMDLTLVAIEFTSKYLLYAGANNPLWIVRNKSLIELEPDKQAISASDEIEKKPFRNKEFVLQENDMVYLFTDGYADQFGGPKGKKFKYSKLQELLVEISESSMENQKLKLNEVFENWRGSLEQVDDVLIVGIRIP